jgi:ribonuclease HI
MTRTKKATVKKREAFVAHKPPGKVKVKAHQPPALSPDVREQNELRMARILQELLGHGRKFAGKVTIPHHDVATAEDYFRVEDIREDLESGQAAVYWVDGSNRAGFLGASVVRYENRRRKAFLFKLGRRFRGSSDDAELFAIAAALELAKCSVQDGQDLQLLRIFSDCQSVLMGLQTGKLRFIGPLHHKFIALQQVFETTDWLLSQQSVRVELIWVKGHSASKGNRMADRSASHAIERQLLAERTESAEEVKHLDVPRRWRRLGQHWVAEWEYRVGFKDLFV